MTPAAHQIDHDAERLLRGERLNRESSSQDMTPEQLLEWAKAQPRRVRKTDEHGRSFEIKSVVDGGEHLSAESYLKRLKGKME